MALSQDDAQARSELLLRDAEEALQQERLHEFWRAWGGTIIGMAIMLVIGTGAGVAWREWREARDARSTEQLVKITDNPAIPMDDAAAKKMKDEHAAIGWLVKAGTVTDASTPDARKQLQADYAAAAKDGGNSSWGYLARWNELRMKMDDDKQDPEKLISQFEKLGDDMGKSSLAALPYTDAAVVTGERLKDPKRALEFLDKAEEAAGAATQMQVHIADLRHLYEIRAQINATPENAK